MSVDILTTAAQLYEKMVRSRRHGNKRTANTCVSRLVLVEYQLLESVPLA